MHDPQYINVTDWFQLITFILILKVTGSNYFFKCSLYRQLSLYVLNLRNELGYKYKVMTLFPNWSQSQGDCTVYFVYYNWSTVEKSLTIMTNCLLLLIVAISNLNSVPNNLQSQRSVLDHQQVQRLKYLWRSCQTWGLQQSVLRALSKMSPFVLHWLAYYLYSRDCA